MSFEPAWWLNNAHLQTMWPAFCRPRVDITLERERIELPDGDFIDLDWTQKRGIAPIVLILHGFEGSIDSHYAKGMLQVVAQHDWRGVFMHFRGCSGEPNRLVRGYHSADTLDLAFIIQTLLAREPHVKIAAVGFSLGGSILLKWLGETAIVNPLKAAIAISVPFELAKAVHHISWGFSRIYEWYLVKCAKQRLQRKFQIIAPPFDVMNLSEVQGFKELDGIYTAPVHGFLDVEDYYAQSSSRQYLHNIRVPTLLLHAKDDPFMNEDVIPAQSELSDQVTLELTETGGHLGFVSGNIPGRPEYWLEQRVPAFLQDFL